MPAAENFEILGGPLYSMCQVTRRTRPIGVQSQLDDQLSSVDFLEHGFDLESGGIANLRRNCIDYP